MSEKQKKKERIHASLTPELFSRLKLFKKENFGIDDSEAITMILIKHFKELEDKEDQIHYKRFNTEKVI